LAFASRLELLLFNVNAPGGVLGEWPGQLHALRGFIYFFLGYGWVNTIPIIYSFHFFLLSCFKNCADSCAEKISAAIGVANTKASPSSRPLIFKSLDQIDSTSNTNITPSDRWMTISFLALLLL
jgi:hypothetical protein